MIRLFSLLVVVLLLASASLSNALAFPPSNSSGQTACAELQDLLGQKVTKGLNPSFLDSTHHYYSALQTLNVPACAVAPSAYADVQTAMKTIRKYNASMAVKAGGHNTNNYWSSVKGGVLIDLKNLNAKSFDEAKQQGYYQPGNRWGDLYKYYAQFGQVVVGGRLSSVGSGLGIGGGLSFLSAQYGLVCDGFQALDVVLPDGSLVTATKTNAYSDLLFSIKGGGNQFGIVVGYTVDTHPIADVWGGLLIFGADQALNVYQEAIKFNNENTDAKAAIIATYNVIGTPNVDLSSLGLPNFNLDKFLILFNVYDGPDGKAAFEAFEKIPHLFDTRKKQSYVQIADMVDIGTTSSGVVSYRAGTQESVGGQALTTLQDAVRNFEQVAEDVKGTYDILSFDFQPVPASLVEASRARGGNAHLSPDGPYYWINYLFSYLPGTPGTTAALAKFKASAEKTPNAPGKPIFLNDANADQPILQSYGGYSRLQAAKSKYDPSNFLSTNMGGPRFT